MKIPYSFVKLAYPRAILLISLVASLGVKAQSDACNTCSSVSLVQWGVSIGAGAYTSLGDKPFDLTNKIRPGVSIELDYKYQFSQNKKWSVALGVGYEQLSIAFTKDNLMHQGDYIDYEGHDFLFTYKAKTYQEKWSMGQVNIPLTLEYSTKALTGLYFRTGLKYSIQVDTQVDMSYQDVETSGYFKQWDMVLTHPEFLGFGYFEQVSSNKSLKLSNRWAWITEIGIKHELPLEKQFYTAVYFDIGLNDQAKNIPKTAQDLLQYTPEPGDALQPTSFTELANDNKAVLKTYSIGLKVRYAF